MQVQTPDFMAEEDMAFLLAICKSLKERLDNFSINLPDGAVLTNIGTENIKFVGIDQIKYALDTLMRQAGDSKWCLVMPTNMGTTRQKIGELYAIPVYIDPAIPKGNFLIQEEVINEKD